MNPQRTQKRPLEVSVVSEPLGHDHGPKDFLDADQLAQGKVFRRLFQLSVPRESKVITSSGEYAWEF